MKTAKNIVLGVLATTALSGCTGLLLGSNSTPESRPAAAAGSAATAEDSRISGVIRQRFSQDPDVSRYALGISTVSRKVTLSGTVGSYDVRDKALQLASSTEGVHSVDSRIVVNTNL